MHIEYDRENDTAYVSLVAHIADGAAVRQIPVTGIGADAEVFLDVDASGRLLGIEVIGAEAALPAEALEQSTSTR
ncbi:MULTISPECIES: DUF2283 domain-containing protein [Streptomyces]|uniref:DUF2283 domain-containing protein n=1 Tax=Streptomyces koelreuteriae TaxID=2838015 RepID=A0ABX8FQG9_9ACTN|nr:MULTISPECIES: DUF2283 domain-containing protein [Streptomyces]QWB23289.1 DUF2283 domain-containing protein [Streptomyces koelreuteriae]UUA06241.1 DUF2283 domain-containing protein [Streptomyces koelreuteriae]UUA13868.1 DUF2283 domain-containing protein [Streptomyces sp. CRCS-T-1]